MFLEKKDDGDIQEGGKPNERKIGNFDVESIILIQLRCYLNQNKCCTTT